MEKIIEIILYFLNCLFEFYIYNLLLKNFLKIKSRETLHQFFTIAVPSLLLAVVNIYHIAQLNMAVYLLLALAISLVNFEGSLKTKLLFSFLVTSFSSSIEVLISYFAYFIYGEEFTIISKGYAENIILTLLAQIVLFFFIQLVIHIFRGHRYLADSKESIYLFILPITSVFVIFQLIGLESSNFYSQLFNLITCFGLALANLSVFYTHDKIVQRFELLNRLKALEKHQIEQAQHYKLIEQEMKSTHAIMHDFKDHLNILHDMCKTDVEASKYITEMISSIDGKSNIKGYGISNRTLEIILNEEREKCKEFGIKFNLKLDYPNISFLNHLDTCSIFANALNNAISACLNVPDKNERYITLVISKYQQMVFISIENANNIPIKIDKDGSTLISTKDDRSIHGYGLENIKRTVKKYGGQLSLDYSNNYFKLFITIPIVEMQ